MRLILTSLMLVISLLLLNGYSQCQPRRSTPQAVEAIAMGPREIRVHWNPVPGALRYTIIRDGARMDMAAASPYIDNSCEPGRTYRYSVAVVNGSASLIVSRPYSERTFDTLPDRTKCDLLIVGATSAGVAAAITAARYGMDAILIEETRRLGGMPVNGLGATDIRRQEHSSGLFEEFRLKVKEIYGGNATGFNYEPRVAHQAMKEILWIACGATATSGRPGLRVYRQVRPVKVKMRGSDISEVVCEELPAGRRVVFEPKFVIDATECGDVAAWAGAPFRVGRESRSKREPHAGHLFYDRANDRPLPGSTGKGDKRVQAYAYLMTVKDYGPGADKTIPKPPGYGKSKYEHAPKWELSWAVGSGKLPGGKFEVNQHPHGSDLQSVNYRYPVGTYAERRRVEELYKNHDLGYLYYLQTEEGHRSLGLSDDDYRDTDNWPSLLYIREARRFESDVVLDEADITYSRRVTRPDAIGLGDYPMDSHAVQPKTDWSTGDLGEGEFYLPQYSPWHQAPYHAMVPKRVDNVWVPTAVSATHVAYGTLRLEPVRMHFGEAAGIAAYLCLRHGVTPRTVPIRQIQAELVKRSSGSQAIPARDGIGNSGASRNASYLYFFPDLPPDTPKSKPIQWLGARGFFPSAEPTERTAASGQTASPFKPNDPVTAGEAARLLSRLAGRGPGSRSIVVQTGAESSAPLTRAAAANLVARFIGIGPKRGAHHYADAPPGHAAYSAAEALFAISIDSRLWDYEKAFAPEGKFFFRPDQPVTRAQFAQLVYFAHEFIGPLWEDYPADQHEIAVK